MLVTILLSQGCHGLDAQLQESIVLNYVKNPGKIVQNYQCFLAAVCLTESQDVLVSLLKPDLFVNKQGFQSKAQVQELRWLLKAYSSIDLKLLNEK